MDRLRTILLALTLLAAGCGSGNREVAAPSPGTQPGAAAPGSAESAPSAATSSVSIKDLELAYNRDKKAFEAAKGDPKAKAAFIESANKLADKNLMADELPPRVKYPTALKYYREVLKVDPKNENASKNAELIVGIYKQMGRPVPGGS